MQTAKKIKPSAEMFKVARIVCGHLQRLQLLLVLQLLPLLALLLSLKISSEPVVTLVAVIQGFTKCIKTHRANVTLRAHALDSNMAQSRGPEAAALQRRGEHP